MSLAAVHANHRDSWYTPLQWWRWVSKTFGGQPIFDPCPEEPGGWDGLVEPWDQSRPWYVNYPGGRRKAGQPPACVVWWRRAVEQGALIRPFIWCAFSIDSIRHLTRDEQGPMFNPGWLVWPHGSRTAFVDSRTGEPQKSPPTTAVWWSTIEPAEPPVPCAVIRTGQ